MTPSERNSETPRTAGTVTTVGEAQHALHQTATERPLVNAGRSAGKALQPRISGGAEGHEFSILCSGRSSVLLRFSMPSNAGQSPSQDPVKLSPQYYKVQLENDRVRVLEYRLKPGEKEVMHSHPAVVVHFLSDATVRTTLPDGTKSETTIKNDDIVWREPVSHTTENIGRTELHAVLLELKGSGR